MKLIGLLGGMSWESTAHYYKIINETIRQELGGLHSAKIVLYSVDFGEIEKCQSAGDWDKSAEILSQAAKKLELAGVDYIAICTNTMHKVADKIQQNITAPIIHIADETAKVLKKHQINKVGLLGTKYTMEQDFYKRRLIEQNIDVVVPSERHREFINNTIYNELCLGQINPDSKKRFLSIIDEIKKDGAQGTILGCTEIGILIKQNDTEVPLFDTTEIHAKRIAKLSIEK